jgi:hypothetical protein
MMKNKILVSIILFLSIFAFGQQTETENLIKLDSTWGQEIFPFPINFARGINYRGIAEVRFPPKGWLNPEHPFFGLIPMSGAFIIVNHLLQIS